VSLRLYAHNELSAPAIVDELRAQACLATEHGFDGVMTSEHHGGFSGYLPNPTQMAGWALEAMPTGWAAPCPILLPLRPAALVAEETAWLAARFPGRVGLGVAAGALRGDFELMGVPMHALADRFAAGLATVAAALSGRASGVLAGDRAIQRCATHPVPVLSAAMGFTAVRRAASHGVGLLFDSLSSPARIRTLVDAYRDAGGRAACVVVRRVWLGDPPRQLIDQQVDVYRGYASDAAQSRWTGNELATGADELIDAVTAAGADAVNIRIHAAGVSAAAARDQIIAIGSEVVPALRAM
jgi:alkanesulfonate monooxygenase SsuD/methylene tetrahydromethanopterin reductase-like flavin-dependent oxidoreductase (luciferase family)